VAKDTETLTRALHVEILRPVSLIEGKKETPVSWDEIGPILRGLRSFSSRLKNAAVLGAILTDRQNRKYEKDDPRRQPPHSATYQAIPGELEDCRSTARKQLEKIQAGQDERVGLRDQKQKALEKLKPTAVKKRETLAAEIEKLDATIKQVEWTIRQRSTEASLELPSAIQRATANEGHVAFQKWKKEPWTRIPSAKQGAPIPVPASDCAVRLIDGKLYLEAKLTPKGKIRFLVTVGKGAQWSVARAIAAGEIPHGAIKLVFAESKRKWFAKIAYTVPRPTAPANCDPDQVLVLHRGWHNFLFLLSTTGHFSKISGQKLLAQKAKIRARRTDTKRIGRHERGTGAKGHGQSRYSALPNRLEDLEANIVKTTCQQHAARVVQLAVLWGVGRIAIEKFGGMPEADARHVRREVPHPPYFQLKTAIAHALNKVGLELEEYDCHYISQTCPRCGSQDARHAKRRHGIFRCIDCGYERELDLVSAFHALVKVNGSAGEVWEARHAEQRRMLATVEKAEKASEQKAADEAPRRAGDKAPRAQGRSRRSKDSVLSVSSAGGE
jgi:hypothetical protein